MALDCGERCVRKIQWLAKALCNRCFGEDCTYQHVTITDDLLNSMDTNSQCVVFKILYMHLLFSFWGYLMNFELIEPSTLNPLTFQDK